MNVVLSQTAITDENMARARHHVPACIHPYVVQGERISHFFWLEGETPVTLTIAHDHQYAIIYRNGEKICEGCFDESLCLMVAGCCGVCYRLIDGKLVPLDESQIDSNVQNCAATLPAPVTLNMQVPLPTPMMSFPKRTRGRVSRTDSHGYSKR